MFRLFSKQPDNQCPIDLDMRLWMENAFLWLAEQFGNDNIATKPMLLPTPEHFPIRYDGSIESLTQTAKIIAQQMEIDLTQINLHTYEQSIQEFEGDAGFRMWTEVDKETGGGLSAGIYFDKDENGKYDILIEKRNLTDPENMVATLAHEFAHVKLLGEGRLETNDEFLTDLTPVVFGLGIFNANSSYKEWRSFDSYGHNTTGYLKQREWGYALALYAHFRKEANIDWLKYLTSNLKSDFTKSISYINENPDKIFKEDYKSGS